MASLYKKEINIEKKIILIALLIVFVLCIILISSCSKSKSKYGSTEKSYSELADDFNCYSSMNQTYIYYEVPLSKRILSYNDVKIYAIGKPSTHHYALDIFNQHIKSNEVSYIRFDYHEDAEVPNHFEKVEYSYKLNKIIHEGKIGKHNFSTTDTISLDKEFLHCGSYMLHIHLDTRVKNVFWISAKNVKGNISYSVAKSNWKKLDNEQVLTFYEVNIFSDVMEAFDYIFNESEKNIIIDIDTDILRGYITSYAAGEITIHELKEFLNHSFELHNSGSKSIEYIAITGGINFVKFAIFE